MMHGPGPGGHQKTLSYYFTILLTPYQFYFILFYFINPLLANS